jgi:REP element-mobilizing transposase RayT
MANTYTQIHIHTIFAVQNRMSLINRSWMQRLYEYIISIIQKHGHKVLSIGGMPDHIHILFGFRPTQALSVLVQEVKRDSSAWINNEKLIRGRFLWQEGYGAFSYSKSHILQVSRYIEMQEEHHKKKTFSEEYKNILTSFDLKYDEEFIFKPIESQVAFLWNAKVMCG